MKDFLKYTLANPIITCGMIFLVSVLSLMFALTSQYVFGLEPCILCIYQRWPYAVTAGLAIIGLGTLYSEETAKYSSIMIFLSAIVFFVSALIAFYHVGVEQHWWVSAVEGCAVNFTQGSVEELVAMIDNRPAARCDEIAWSFLGISMAGYNTLLSLVMTVACTFSAIFIRRRENGVL